MNSREIAEMAAWTAKSIKDSLAMDGRRLDDAGEDIIKEYLRTDMRKWQLGEKITLESSSQLVKEILSRRRHETGTFDEVFSALLVLSSKFPDFVASNLRQREAEAKRIAAKMPAIKV